MGGGVVKGDALIVPAANYLVFKNKHRTDRNIALFYGFLASLRASFRKKVSVLSSCLILCKNPGSRRFELLTY